MGMGLGMSVTDASIYLQTSPHYVKLMEKLIISTCKDCKFISIYMYNIDHPLYYLYFDFLYTVDIEDLRHLSTTLSTMASEKQKAKVSQHNDIPYSG